ncbi:hypothetical protein GL50803_0017055 [Giardia duodenalis]|uniref:Uncharacterized protein n=2 Tax=Giardia intestinalis TaxID=5741 RepID=A8BNT2_GIAIC|nr:hypothetical protein GL50803_0017055 [Giardia intestinalis]KAE8304674.1 hypothetical protein GL50803_0017055 [Giardia intestinalis]|eukprot:XP_001705795.1 Spindle pole protein, putative [Giardia lamblia ATCC 50803]
MVDSSTTQASAVEQLPEDERVEHVDTEQLSAASAKKISIVLKGASSTDKPESDDCKGEEDNPHKESTTQDSASEADKNAKKPRKERLRSEYPKVIEPLPPKPDYGPVEKAVKKLDDKIAKSKETVASIIGEISSLDEKLKNLSFDALSEDLRNRLKAARDEFSALQSVKKEIYERLNPVTAKIKSIIGDGQGLKNFNTIADQLARLKYESEHTSMTPEEEKKTQASIKKLSEKVKCLPKVRELEEERASIEKELEELKKKIDPVKKQRDQLEKEANEALSKNNPDRLDRSVILAKIKELRARKDKENEVLDTLYSEKRAITTEYRTAMRAYTSEERRVEAQTSYRGFLRNKWKTLCKLINGAGATITEQGDESGEFVVSSYPLTDLPKRALQRSEREVAADERVTDKSAIGLAIVEAAKAKLAKWCEEAIATGSFGTTKTVKTGKRTEVILNKDLCELLNVLDIDHSSVSSKEEVTKILKMCRGELDDDDEEAKEQKRLAEEEAKKAAAAAEEEARKKAEEAEEKKQKRLSEINAKIASWIDEMVEFKAVIRFA